MKIVITTGIYPPQIGGPAQYALELSRALQELGHQVIVKTYTHELKMPILIRHFYFFLKSLLAIARADIVIALDTLSVGWPSVCAGNLVGTPVIIRTGGDFLWESYVERTGDLILLREFYDEDKAKFLSKLSFKERMIFKLTSYTLAKVDKLIFSTEWQKDIWKRPYKLDPNKISIIENFYPGQVTASRSATSDSDKKIIKIVAATRPLKWKNLDMLRRVVDRINSNLKAENGSSQIILDTDLLPYKDNLERLKTADLAVLISLGDISPNMIIDAISVGCRCVLTRENGIRERVSGFVYEVDPLNELEIEKTIKDVLFNSSKMRTKEPAFGFSFTHTWLDIAKEFINEINTVARGGYTSRDIDSNQNRKICAMFSSDFNLLDRESYVFKRHKEYAKKYNKLFIGLIGKIPKNNIPIDKVVVEADSDNMGALEIFTSKNHQKVMIFLDVLLRMFRLIKSYNYNRQSSVYISCQDPFFTGLAGWLLRVKLTYTLNIRPILEIQLHTDVSNPLYRQMSIGNRLRFYMAKIILPRADSIRVVAGKIARSLESDFNIPTSKIFIRPIDVDMSKINGLNPDDRAKIREDLRKRFPKWKFIALTVGRLEVEKNIFGLINAWSEVIKDISKIGLNNGSIRPEEIGLVIIGSGSQESEISCLISQLKIQTNIVMEPWTNNINQYYFGADLYISNSLYEGYGMAMLEAVATGLPLISTDAGIAPELLSRYPDKVRVVPVRDNTGLKKEILERILGKIQKIQ